MNLIIFFIVLLVLVLIHEFGHFFAAKKFRMRVDEFGFGFPPKLFGIKKEETEYTFNLLPLGGFVKIFGENPEISPENGDESRSFQNKPKWQQAVVLVAGVCANFLLAWLLFSIGFMSGFPTSVESGQTAGYEVRDASLMIISVVNDSPADLGGLTTGDRIITVSSETAELSEINPENLKSFIVTHGGKEINVDYVRAPTEAINNASITPTNPPDGDPTIGISMDQVGIAKLSPPRAIWEGLGLTLSVTRETALGLYTLIADSVQGRGDLDIVTGPVGLVGIVGDAYSLGFVYLLSFTALISINLAVINLIPFPALDGGRLLFLLIEKIKGSRIKPALFNTLNAVGFIILILLMVLVTFHDLTRLF